MKKSFAKIACGLAAASLALTLVACDDSSSASVNGPDIDDSSSPNNVSGPDNEEFSSESNGGDNPEVSSDSGNGSENVESSATAESSATEGGSSASLDGNSSSSLAVTCQALTLECYSATQLCNKGLTEYCVNSSSSGKDTCQHVSDVDGGTCQDNDVVLDCATGVNAVCNNNNWIPAIIGASCPTTGKEMTVNEINLICNEGYWKYKSTIDKCPPGSSCQRPNYSCGTHPINGFSCKEVSKDAYELVVNTWSAGDCLYQCSGGKYHVIMPPAPVGD